MSYGLQFQDFGLGGADSPFTNPAGVNPNYDHRNTEKDNAKLVDGPETETVGTQHSLFSFKFYQQFFDVDTEQVQTRILNSALPKKNCNFIRDHVQPSPDLYGPFWISVTLVFCASICGNLARYIDVLGEENFSSDFKLVSGIASIITCYVLLVPFAIYILLYYRNSTLQYTYPELVSLYGYSLAIFIPVSILWVIHYQWLRWSLIAVSITLSGFVLCSTILDALKTDKNKVLVLGVVCGVLLLHTGFAVGMKEYYFDSVISINEKTPDLPKPVANNLPLSNNSADSKTEAVPKSDALLSPGKESPKPKKENDKKEEPKKPAEQMNSKTDGKQDTKSKDGVDQKPPAKLDNESKDKPKADVKS